MNVFREVRKVKNRKPLTRLKLILMLIILLISSTYAWMNFSKNVKTNGLQATVNSWDVFYLDEANNILNEEFSIYIDEFYPGMPDIVNEVYIKNAGSTSSDVNVELTSVKLFDVEILNDLKANNEIKTIDDIVYLFTDDEHYPFDMNYRYDKLIAAKEKPNPDIENAISNDKLDEYPESKFELCMSWEYEYDDKNTNTDKTTNTADIKARDDLDVDFAKRAYEYYETKLEELKELENQGENVDSQKEKLSALTLTFKITSQIHEDTQAN